MTAGASRTPGARTWLQLFRVASLLVPAALAWRVVSTVDDGGSFDRPFGDVLGPLWCSLCAAFAMRFVEAVRRHRQQRVSHVSLLDRIDILTASGSALSWLSAGAIALSVWIGWASLSVVGLLGLGVFHVTAIAALWLTGGDDPWRRRSLTRRFITECAVEGAPVLEEVQLSGPRIPFGFRLFARGRVGPRWTTSRYVVDGSDDGSEIRLQTDVGPAIRGEHDAEPLEVWLEDVLGLCHSMSSRAGSASLLVRPRPRPLLGAREVLRARDGLDETRTARQLATEGSLQLREYQAGDDARRIHWARSLSAGQTLVRTPDEAPRDDQAVRVVLDTYLPGAGGFTCPAPAELLDTLVAIWLGIGRSLTDAGVRVDLVVADPDGVRIVALRTSVGRKAQADDLGARARWQSVVPLERLLSRKRAVVVSYRHQPISPNAGPPLWVLAREWAWVGFDRSPPAASLVLLPHPMGSPENRPGRRRHESVSYWRARRDHGRFTRLCGDDPTSGGVRAGAGTLLATPSRDGAIQLERLS